MRPRWRRARPQRGVARAATRTSTTRPRAAAAPSPVQRTESVTCSPETTSAVRATAGQGELEQHRPDVRDQGVRREAAGAEAPRADHQVVQRHAGGAAERQHVGHGAAGEVQVERALTAQPGKGRGEHERVHEQAGGPQHREQHRLGRGDQLERCAHVVHGRSDDTRQHVAEQRRCQGEREHDAWSAAVHAASAVDGRVRLCVPDCRRAVHPRLLPRAPGRRGAPDGRHAGSRGGRGAPGRPRDRHCGGAGLSSDGTGPDRSLADHRRAELAAAAAALGCARWELLDYEDSGWGEPTGKTGRRSHGVVLGSRPVRPGRAPGRPAPRGAGRRPDDLRRARWLRPPRPRPGAPGRGARGRAGRHARGARGDGRPGAAAAGGLGDAVAAGRLPTGSRGTASPRRTSPGRS